MKTTRLIIISLGLTLLAASCTPGGLFQKVDNLKTISVGAESLRVEVMDTDAERAQGLSGRDSLPATEGMLFDFTNSTEHRPSFWMKGMKFSLDIIWIKDNKIVAITKNVPPPPGTDYIPTYKAPKEIDYVLEVNANWCDNHQISEGATVQF